VGKRWLVIGLSTKGLHRLLFGHVFKASGCPNIRELVERAILWDTSQSRITIPTSPALQQAQVDVWKMERNASRYHRVKVDTCVLSS